MKIIFIDNYACLVFRIYKYNICSIMLFSANKNNLLYIAREFEIDTGLQFNRMRYYSSNLGRFMQKDMIFKETENYYEYSSNNPINKIDPFGLMPPWLWH